jgi:branched-chain amino acid transport system ATP-binding protein
MAPASTPEPLLEIRDLVKRFGALAATDRLSLTVRRGEVHALIGPNGAGKTSLIAQIAGTLSADSGHIVFQGRDITRLAAHRRVRRGLVRSFQITRLFTRFSVIENVALAVQARSGSSLSFWRPVAGERALHEEARAVLDLVGLADRAETPCGQLPHGEQRSLEVALALATRPALLLLDEPLAGTGPQESERMVALIQRLRQQVTILLVEHDVDAVFRLADTVSVLVGGRVIASGAPDVVRRDPEVVTAYLGTEAAAEGEGGR